MKLTKKLILVCLIFLIMPASVAFADTNNEEDDFYVKLAMMATTNNRMDGVLSTDDYAAIANLANEVIEKKLNQLKNTKDLDYDSQLAYDGLAQYQVDLMNALLKKYNQRKKQDARDILDTIIQISSTIEDKNDAVKTIPQVISDGAGSVNTSNLSMGYSDDLFEFAKNIHFDQSIDQTDLAIDTFVAYIADSTAAIDTQNENQSDNDGSAIIIGGVSSDPNASQNVLPGEIDLRPVKFVNSGTEPATVMVSEFSSAPGYSASMSMASTVVFPGQSNSSALLDLPLGTYVFCFEWELNEDIDGDDYIDYKHGFTSPFTLNINHSDDPSLAVQVSFSAPATNPTNGRCRGENNIANGLTPEEQANQGTYAYYVTESDGNTDISEIFNSVTFNFGNGRVNVTIEGETMPFANAGLNHYTYSDAELEMSFTFTMDGFLYTYKAEWGFDGIEYVISNGTGIRQ